MTLQKKKINLHYGFETTKEFVKDDSEMHVEALNQKRWK